MKLGKSTFTIQNPQIKVFDLCYRSYEKINNSYQLFDRYYIISLDGLVVKDIIALNIPQNVDNMLHAVPNMFSMDISKEDLAIKTKLKDYQVLEFYFYISPKWKSRNARYKEVPYPDVYPIVSMLQGSKFLKGVYVTIDKNANIEIDKNNIYFKSNTFHNSLDSMQKFYNILPYK